jgi:hypothetical protein
VSGSIVDDGLPGAGTADAFFTPEDVGAACAVAAGIDPFAEGNFPLGELSGLISAAGDHEGAMGRLLTEILGT